MSGLLAYVSRVLLPERRGLEDDDLVVVGSGDLSRIDGSGQAPGNVLKLCACRNKSGLLFIYLIVMSLWQTPGMIWTRSNDEERITMLHPDAYA